jgi:ATP-binding cassette subfamily B protein
MVKNYNIAILDEPSSALDPIAKYELNQNIMELAEGSTVIFISHRLSSTRMADKVYLFENGSIIEQGSHEELMQLGGKYAEMFNKQAYYYKNSDY